MAHSAVVVVAAFWFFCYYCSIIICNCAIEQRLQQTEG